MQDSECDSTKVAPFPDISQPEPEKNADFVVLRKYSSQSFKVAPGPLDPSGNKKQIMRRDSFIVAPAPDDSPGDEKQIMRRSSFKVAPAPDDPPGDKKRRGSFKVAPAPDDLPGDKERRGSFKVAPAPYDDAESNRNYKVSSPTSISKASARWIKVQALVEFLKVRKSACNRNLFRIVGKGNKGNCLAAWCR